MTEISFMGFPAVVTVDYRVTEHGARPIIDYDNGGDPGWGPEWEIEQITIQVENGFGLLGPEFVATGELFKVLSDSDEIEDAIKREVERARPIWLRRPWRSAWVD